jgi:hypothetical protein
MDENGWKRRTWKKLKERKGGFYNSNLAFLFLDGFSDRFGAKYNGLLDKGGNVPLKRRTERSESRGRSPRPPGRGK